MSALAAGHLVKSHMKHNRSSQNLCLNNDPAASLPTTPDDDNNNKLSVSYPLTATFDKLKINVFDTMAPACAVGCKTV